MTRIASILGIMVLLTLSGSGEGTVVIQTAAAGGAAPNDWTSSFVAVWLMEEATNNDRTNETATTCGSDCDLAESTGDDIGQDGTNYIEGSYSAALVKADGELLQCDWTSSASCDELNTAVNAGPVTWGAWYRPTSSCGGAQGSGDGCEFYAAQDYSGNGPRINREPWDGAGGVNCKLDTATTDAAGTLTVGAWHHIVCTYANDADDELNLYTNGTAETSPSTLSSRVTVSAVESFFVGGSQSGSFDGEIDEAFFIDEELTAAEVAHIGACGIDGSYCACSGTTYTDEGRSDSECTGSGTPYKCCTGSGTGCIDNALLTGDCNATAP